MTSLRMILPFTLCLSFMTGCQAKEINEEERAEDERTVEELQSRFSQAFAARDLSAIVSLYADNAHYITKTTLSYVEGMPSGTHGNTILTEKTSS